MVEVVGDPVLPSDLVVPSVTDTPHTRTGSLWISGGKLQFYNGSAVETVTSA